MANPASVYCVEQGGKLEMVTEDGQRVTYCVTPAGERMEQWEYFRKNHVNQ
ncbi:hemolysin [Vibrio metoecus]|nr:hemolysin [Vibrio metoecus]